MPTYGKPDRLYTADDLLDGYDRNDPAAFTKSWDFRTYATYVADGAATPKTLQVRLAQAEHDARIAEAQHQTHQARAELAQLQAQLREVYASRSWRVTGPLRRISSLVQPNGPRS